MAKSAINSFDLVDFLHKIFGGHLIGAILMLGAAVAALLLTNSTAHEFYLQFLNMSVNIAVSDFGIHKSFLMWVNEGLMAIFFFVIGLELKRELLEGHLTDRQALLPAIAAIGGMLVPALIFFVANYGDPIALRGWAIPTATDIAFTLGILFMLGPRVPTSLKVFLLALAILDDLGAILIIALYYTASLSFQDLVYAAFAVVALAAINHLFRVRIAMPYLLIGGVLWYFTLKSGIHATIAGVVLAFAIPAQPESNHSLIKHLEDQLAHTVSFIILPLFAFCNAGVYLLDSSLASLSDSITLGILLGLFLGKPIGICLFSWVAIHWRLGNLPKDVTWPMFLGMAFLCGVGFTVSLFVTILAHGDFSVLLAKDKIGVLLGSLLSGLVGYLILRHSLPKGPFGSTGRIGS